MFDSAPYVHDQDFQLYISMLEGLIVDIWSAAEYLLLLSNSAQQDIMKSEGFRGLS